MTGLKEYHEATVKGIYKIRLDHNATLVIDSFFSDVQDKLLLFCFGREGKDGYVVDLHFVCGSEILHKTAVFIEKLETKTVVSLNEQFVCFIEERYIKLFLEGRG